MKTKLKRFSSCALALLMVFALLAGSLTVGAESGAKLLSSGFASESILIDGDLTESSWNLVNSAENLTEGVDPDNIMTFDTAWDDEYFYVGLKVIDDVVINSNWPDGSIYFDDTIEIFIDVENSKLSSYGPGDNQIFVRVDDDRVFTTRGNATTELSQSVTAAHMITDDGYTMEVAIPWAALGSAASDGKKIGFDIANDDCDVEGEMRKAQITWNNIYGDNWGNPSRFGTAILYKAVLPLISSEGTPVVDGALGTNEWSLANSFATDSAEISFASLCDWDYLYFAADVADGDIAEGDSLVFSLNGDNSRQSGEGHGNYEVSVPLGDGKSGAQDGSSTAAGLSDGGGAVEVAIPWTAFGISPTDGIVMGFNLEYVKADGSGGVWESEAPYASLTVENANVVKPAYVGPKETFKDSCINLDNVFESSGQLLVSKLSWGSLRYDAAIYTWSANQYITYKSPEGGIIEFTVTVAEMNDTPKAIGLYASADNETYVKLVENVNYKVVTTVSPGNDTGWYAERQYQSISVPDGVNYLKIGLDGIDSSNGYHVAVFGVGFDYISSASLPTVILEDPCDNLSLAYETANVYAQSAWAGGTLDDSNIAATDSGSENDGSRYIVYKSPGGDILNIAVDTVEGDSVAGISFHGSKDGVSYTPIKLTRTKNEMQGGWYYLNTYEAQYMTSGYRYLKIQFDRGPGSGWCYGVSNVVIEAIKDNKPPVLDLGLRNYITMVNEPIGDTVVVTDPDGDDVTLRLTSGPRYGKLDFDGAAGQWEYTPNADFMGFDSFTVEADDGNDETVTGKISVQVSYPAEYKDYYVSAIDGDDSNDGSLEQPFKTIQRASDVSKPGNTIHIMNGTYTEVSSRGAVHISRSGLPEAYITYKPYEGHTPLINCEYAHDQVFISASYIIIDGLTIVGSSDKVQYEDLMELYNKAVDGTLNWNSPEVMRMNNDGIFIRPNAASQNSNPHHIIIRNCSVSKCTGGGIATMGSDYLSITDNVVFDNCHGNFYANSGISLCENVSIDDNMSEYKSIVEGNVCYDNYNIIPWYVTKAMSDGNGIIIDYNKWTYVGRTLVANNITYRNGGSGIHCYNSSFVDIINNTAYKNNVTPGLFWGQIFSNACDNSNLINNILYAETGGLIYADHTANIDVLYDYNVFYGGVTPSAKPSVGAHNITADPLFADPDNGDFTLAYDSPAIDAGASTYASWTSSDSTETLSAPSVDYADAARPVGNGIDIGAYEMSVAPIEIKDYYVSAIYGSNSNDGSLEYPFRTIQRASDVSTPGSTIYIMEGTYTDTSGQGTVFISRSGLPNAYITYKAYEDHKPVITCVNSWNHILISASYIVIDGLTIVGNSDNLDYEEIMVKYNEFAQGNMTWGNDVGRMNANGIFARPDTVNDNATPHHIVIKNCSVSKCPGGGIGIQGCDYVSIIDNEVFDNCHGNFFANSGISLYEYISIDNNMSEYKMIVEGNICYDNYNTVPWFATKAMSDGNGIIVDDNKCTQTTGIPYVGRTLVVNNIVYGNGGSGIHCYSSNYVDIVNNTAYKNNVTPELDWGQIFSTSCNYTNLINNILYSEPDGVIYADYGNKSTLYDYNVFYGGSTPTSKPSVGGNNITADPLFADPDNGDFTLAADSPAIDAGASAYASWVSPTDTETLSAPSVDYADAARPEGNGIDIGAYEMPAPIVFKDYYVSAIYGSNSNDGSLERPFRTIQRASDVSEPGSTIYIMDGTYTETSGQGAVHITRSGAPDAYITYKPYEGHNPVISCDNAWNNILISASYIILDGLTVVGNSDKLVYDEIMVKYNEFAEGNMTWGIDVGRINANGIYARPDSINDNATPHHIVIKNCSISKVPGGGIGTTGCDYVSIIDNEVFDNCHGNFFGNSGISFCENVSIDDDMSEYKLIIEGNICYDNYNIIPWYVTKAMSDGNGIIVDYNRYSYVGRTLVANNIVYGNGGSGIHCYSSFYVDIINNTAYKNNVTPGLDWGQIFSNQCRYSNLINNILYAEEGGVIYADYGNRSVLYDYNIFYGGSTPSPNPSVGANNITADPRFVDPDNGDFTLRADSPAIDAGTATYASWISTTETETLSAPSVDYADAARPEGNGIDIGAYEMEPVAFIGVTVTTPTIVATLAANLRIYVEGENLEGLTAYLLVGGEEKYATPIVGGTAYMKIGQAPEFGADCKIIVKGEGSYGSCDMTLAKYNPAELWVPSVTFDSETGKLLVTFSETIGHKTGGKIAVTVEGKSAVCSITEDGKGLLIEQDYGEVEPGDVIVISGLKYPVLFPSYSFTFTVAVPAP